MLFLLRKILLFELRMKKANEERIDSSSSEDEIYSNNLKEAIDQQFLNDDPYITRKTEFAPESSK